MADITYAVVQSILDTIYNNINTYDQYPSLIIFENDVRNNDVIFERETTVSEQVRKDVVAMLSNEAYIIDSNTYKVKLLESTAIDQNNGQVKVYDYALSSYVPLSRLVKNICTSLGVKLDDTFADNNRTIYDGMIDIINKFFGNKLENNSLAALKRIGASGSEEYLSFIPKDIIVEFCQYLNDLGIFANSKKVIVPQPFTGFLGDTTGHILPIEPISFYYDFITDWEEYKRVLKEAVYYPQDPDYRLRQEMSSMIGLALDYLVDSYGNEIDLSNNYISINKNGISEGIINFPVTKTIYFRLFPKTTYVKGFSFDYTEIYFNEVTYCQTYQLNITYSDENTIASATSNKTIYTYQEGYYTTVYLLNYSNVKRDKAIRYYMNSYVSSISYPYYYWGIYEYLGAFPTEFTQLKFLDYKHMIWYTGLSGADSEKRPLVILNSAGIEITDKDFLYIEFKSSGDLIIYVIKNCGRARFNTSGITYGKYALTSRRCNTSSAAENESIIDRYQSKGFNTSYNQIIYFENTEECIKLSARWGSTVISDAYTEEVVQVNALNLKTANAVNFGEVIDIKESESFEGLSIIEGATVPQNVYTESAFDAKYSSWKDKYFNDNNVYYLNDQIQSVTYPTKWLPLGVTDSGNASQIAAQGGVINAADIEEIADGIEAAESGEDNPDIEPIDPYDNKVTEDEGTTPDLPALISLPNATALGFFQHCVIKPEDFQYLVSSILASIALPDHIISIQMGYRYGATEGKHKIKFGSVLPESDVICNPLTESISNILFEPNIDIQEKYQNYLDIETTSLVIYLPFVGFNNLDIKDFLGKKLSLMARFDTISGTIVYTVASVVENNTNILYHFQGNCQEQLPFSEDAFAGLLRTTMGVVSQTAIGFAAGKEVGAGLNAANSIISAVNQEPRIAGSFTANSGFLCGLTPYLILRRKKDITPSILPELNGIPANTAVILGQCKGITKVLDVDLKGIDAFDNELDELKQLLAEGVLV